MDETDIPAPKAPRRIRLPGRFLAEVGFIIFLYYSNLLMGEFEASGPGHSKGMAWALQDIVTGTNFAIAIISAAVGYVAFEFLRKRL
jgi:hypothetical protein